MSGFFILDKILLIFVFRLLEEDISNLIVAEDIAGQATISYVIILLILTNPIKVSVIPFHH
jgi:hypothetical protein